MDSDNEQPEAEDEPADARLGGGGCREENRPYAETEYNMCKPALIRGHKCCYNVHI